MDNAKELKRAWLVRLKDRELYCALCGCLIESRKDLTLDHYHVVKSKGGLVSEENARPAHQWCNNARGCHSLKEWEHHGYKYLADLINAWNHHRVKFNIYKVYKSLEALK